jgi:PAS domain S-box-containing protein
MPKPIQIKELTINIINEVLKYRKLNNIESLAKNLLYKNTQNEDLTKSLTNELKIIKRQNNSFKIIIDNLVANIQTNKNGIILESSNKFYSFFGYQSEDIIGKSINDLRCITCGQETFQKMMLTAIHTKKAVVSKYTFLKSNNENILCEVTMTAKYNTESLVDGYMLYLDIL